MEAVNKSDLKVDEMNVILGSHPIVVIGPNGSGKTRLGAKLAQEHNSLWIGALRNLELGGIPMMTIQQAKSDFERSHRDSRERPWQMSSVVQHLLSKLIIEDRESAAEYRDNCMNDQSYKPPITKLMQLRNFWGRHFPNRDIKVAYDPTATSTLTGGDSYPMGQMSDGERVAIYLAASVIDAATGLIFVDEPEVHFHSLLARRFWDDLEDIMTDCRFVYFTHDLQFAISRRSAQFVIMTPDQNPKVLEHELGIPSEVKDSILSAASFNVNAKRFVFCEGRRGGEKDEVFYESWFRDTETAVVGVGSFQQVYKCVTVFNSSPVISGDKAIGIIDRDYEPDIYLKSLPSEIHVLKVHEVENLFCLPEVFAAVGKYKGHQKNEISEKYKSFLTKAKNHFRGQVLNKQILERAKSRVRSHLLPLVSTVSTSSKVGEVRSNFAQALDPSNWSFDGSKLFNEEEQLVKGALEGTVDDFLKVFPGKSFFSHAAKELDVSEKEYVEIIVQALSGGYRDNKAMAVLEMELSAALKSHLPKR